MSLTHATARELLASTQAAHAAFNANPEDFNSFNDTVVWYIDRQTSVRREMMREMDLAFQVIIFALQDFLNEKIKQNHAEFILRYVLERRWKKIKCGEFDLADFKGSHIEQQNHKIAAALANKDESEEDILQGRIVTTVQPGYYNILHEDQNKSINTLDFIARSAQLNDIYVAILNGQHNTPGELLCCISANCRDACDMVVLLSVAKACMPMEMVCSETEFVNKIRASLQMQHGIVNPGLRNVLSILPSAIRYDFCITHLGLEWLKKRLSFSDMLYQLSPLSSEERLKLCVSIFTQDNVRQYIKTHENLKELLQPLESKERIKLCIDVLPADYLVELLHKGQDASHYSEKECLDISKFVELLQMLEVSDRLAFCEAVFCNEQSDLFKLSFYRLIEILDILNSPDNCVNFLRNVLGMDKVKSIVKNYENEFCAGENNKTYFEKLIELVGKPNAWDFMVDLLEGDKEKIINDGYKIGYALGQLPNGKRPVFCTELLTVEFIRGRVSNGYQVEHILAAFPEAQRENILINYFTIPRFKEICENGSQLGAVLSVLPEKDRLKFCVEYCDESFLNKVVKDLDDLLYILRALTLRDIKQVMNWDTTIRFIQTHLDGDTSFVATLHVIALEKQQQAALKEQSASRSVWAEIASLSRQTIGRVLALSTNHEKVGKALSATDSFLKNVESKPNGDRYAFCARKLKDKSKFSELIPNCTQLIKLLWLLPSQERLQFCREVIGADFISDLLKDADDCLKLVGCIDGKERDVFCRQVLDIASNKERISYIYHPPSLRSGYDYYGDRSYDFPVKKYKLVDIVKKLHPDARAAFCLNYLGADAVTTMLYDFSEFNALMGCVRFYEQKQLREAIGIDFITRIAHDLTGVCGEIKYDINDTWQLHYLDSVIGFDAVKDIVKNYSAPIRGIALLLLKLTVRACRVFLINILGAEFIKQLLRHPGDLVCLLDNTPKEIHRELLIDFLSIEFVCSLFSHNIQHGFDVSQFEKIINYFPQDHERQNVLAILVGMKSCLQPGYAAFMQILIAIAKSLKPEHLWDFFDKYIDIAFFRSHIEILTDQQHKYSNVKFINKLCELLQCFPEEQRLQFCQKYCADNYFEVVYLSDEVNEFSDLKGVNRFRSFPITASTFVEEYGIKYIKSLFQLFNVFPATDFLEICKIIGDKLIRMICGGRDNFSKSLHLLDVNKWQCFFDMVLGISYLKELSIYDNHGVNRFNMPISDICDYENPMKFNQKIQYFIPLVRSLLRDNMNLWDILSKMSWSFNKIIFLLRLVDIDLFELTDDLYEADEVIEKRETLLHRFPQDKQDYVKQLIILIGCEVAEKIIKKLDKSADLFSALTRSVLNHLKYIINIFVPCSVMQVPYPYRDPSYVKLFQEVGEFTYLYRRVMNQFSLRKSNASTGKVEKPLLHPLNGVVDEENRPLLFSAVDAKLPSLIWPLLVKGLDTKKKVYTFLFFGRTAYDIAKDIAKKNPKMRKLLPLLDPQLDEHPLLKECDKCLIPSELPQSAAQTSSMPAKDIEASKVISLSEGHYSSSSLSQEQSTSASQRAKKDGVISLTDNAEFMSAQSFDKAYYAFPQIQSKANEITDTDVREAVKIRLLQKFRAFCELQAEREPQGKQTWLDRAKETEAKLIAKQDWDAVQRQCALREQAASSASSETHQCTTTPPAAVSSTATNSSSSSSAGDSYSTAATVLGTTVTGSASASVEFTQAPDVSDAAPSGATPAPMVATESQAAGMHSSVTDDTTSSAGLMSRLGALPAPIADEPARFTSVVSPSPASTDSGRSTGMSMRPGQADAS